MNKPITIIGGGLSGLTLGIGLRQRGVPVTVWEAGHYPRHRVCGEFISGHGQQSLARLGLLPLLQNAGARTAETAAFFAGEKSVPARPLPQPALCISRYTLDDLLATEFQRLGGELLAGKRWQSPFGEGAIRATGRRVKAVDGGWRMLGLKIHAANAGLASDLEIHFVPSGYVGLCRIPGGEINICGLFRSKTTQPDLAHRWREWLAGAPKSVLRSRLANAEFDEASFCSVAGISLRPQKGKTWTESCIGDSLTMIPPITGNGMSMAFESAELAISPLVEYSRGAAGWPETQQKIATLIDARFARRLRFSAFLQRILFQKMARTSLLFAARSEPLWRTLFKLTR